MCKYYLYALFWVMIREITVKFTTYRPVVVQMTKFVCQLLDMVWFETWWIFNDIVVDWCNSSLTYCLRAQEEVVELWSCNFRINNGTRKRIWNSTPRLSKETGWHSLLHNNHWKFCDCWIEFVYGLLKLGYFVVLDIVNLKRVMCTVKSFETVPIIITGAKQSMQSRVSNKYFCCSVSEHNSQSY